MDSSLKKALVARRAVFFSGEEHSTPVYNRDLLPRSDKINGPAIIEEMGAVTVVPIGWTSEVGKFGEMHLRRI
jgi:N-methylhydantoinase A/oxoprolinase/acetone carboxylase beta subunit